MAAKPKVSLRRPPTPASQADPDLAEKFIHGRVGESAAISTGRGIVARVRGPARRRMTVYLAPETARRLDVHCAAKGIDKSDFIEDAVSKRLDAQTSGRLGG